MSAALTPSAALIRIRPVGRADARLLFGWVNRPDSLAASLVTHGPVMWDDHCRWLDERLADPASRQWIVEADGRAVGQVRLQDRGQGPEIALYVDEEARGRGIAAATLALVLEEARDAWVGANVIARVRFDNLPSRRLFERAGFRIAGTAADHRVFVKVI